jgi:hypothetical protein
MSNASTKKDDDSPKQKRMREAVERLTKYMATYDRQHNYKDYSDYTFIEDVLYGIGIALEPVEYKYGAGFDKFKVRLKGHLNGERT